MVRNEDEYHRARDLGSSQPCPWDWELLRRFLFCFSLFTRDGLTVPSFRLKNASTGKSWRSVTARVKPRSAGGAGWTVLHRGLKAQGTEGMLAAPCHREAPAPRHIARRGPRGPVAVSSIVATANGGPSFWQPSSVLWHCARHCSRRRGGFKRSDAVGRTKERVLEPGAAVVLRRERHFQAEPRLSEKDLGTSPLSRVRTVKL